MVTSAVSAKGTRDLVLQSVLRGTSWCSYGEAETQAVGIGAVIAPEPVTVLRGLCLVVKEASVGMS